MKYIIEDWAGNRLFSHKEFDSYEDGWDFIYENVDNSQYEESQKDNDNVYQDIYVIQKED